MGDKLKKLDRKTIVNIAGALILGVILLIMSSSIFKPNSNKKTPAQDSAVSPAPSAIDSESAYIAQLQGRLEEALSLIDGAGKVKVMLTLSYGREIDVAEDKTANESTTRDTGIQGGERTTQTSSTESKKIIITGSDGVSAPLVLREVQPKIEGVLIIAEGGDNILVKEALTSAAETVLGLDMSKVQVSKMKS